MINPNPAAGNPDLLDQPTRKNIINLIGGSENVSRKNFEQRKFDIYRKRVDKYVIERLALELSAETVKSMRKVLSINPCKRIIDQLGSIYATEPERNFSGTANAAPPPEPDVEVPVVGEPPPTKPVAKKNPEDDLEKKIEDFYHCNGIDSQMRLANRYYKLCDQAALYVVPRNGKIVPRALTPKDYDVIPDVDNPEEAFAYILNVFDVNMHGVKDSNVKEVSSKYNQNSKLDTAIADDSDRARLLQRFVWWSKEHHFTTDGHGQIIGDSGDGDIANPIGVLPFIDIAIEKDFQFFVRRGSDIAEFTIDLLTQLSDLAEISRMQGYSQAIIYSVDEPRSIVIGPNKVIWIKQPLSAEQSQPKFEFSSPAPDLANGLQIIITQLKMFLTSNGLDASTITGDTPSQQFTSGLDHFLANIDKFKASQEDIDLFRRVETELFDLLRFWSNQYQDVTGDDELKKDLKIGQLSDEIELEVCYAEPAVVETKKEKEDSTIKRWDKGLLTTKDALKELYEFDDDKAVEYMAELSADKIASPRPSQMGAFGQPGAEPPKPGQPPPKKDEPPPNVPPKKEVA